MKKKHMIYFGLFGAALVLSFLTGCVSSTQHVQPAPEYAAAGEDRCPEDILAIVGERAIYISEFQEKFQSILHRRKNIEKQKSETLDQMILMSLLSLAAKDEGLDRAHDVSDAVTSAVEDVLARQYHKKKIKPLMQVSKEEIDNYYNTHLEEFETPEKVRLRHILVAVETDAPEEIWTEAEKKARELKRKIEEGADFKILAKQHSDDKRTGLRGGAMWQREESSTSYFTKKNMPEGVPEDIFSLGAGQVTAPVRTARGYELFKVTAKRDSYILPYKQVKYKIKHLIEDQKYNEIIDKTAARMKKKHGVVLHKDRLASVKIQKKKKKRG